VSDGVLRQRILATFDMFEAGVDLMRQRLKRQYPAETEALLPARRFAVVGGIAVSTRTEPRFTRDLDFGRVGSGRRERRGHCP
jgi:hypothetical protein